MMSVFTYQRFTFQESLNELPSFELSSSRCYCHRFHSLVSFIDFLASFPSHIVIMFYSDGISNVLETSWRYKMLSWRVIVIFTFNQMQFFRFDSICFSLQLRTGVRSCEKRKDSSYSTEYICVAQEKCVSVGRGKKINKLLICCRKWKTEAREKKLNVEDGNGSWHFS